MTTLLTSSGRKTKRRPLGTASWYATALFICAVMIVPLLWMITIGLKSRNAVFVRGSRMTQRDDDVRILFLQLADECCRTR